ncbi:MAG: hypothetical protein EOP85_00010 [Verrucomicrobiaceae bacterium]|nr:MAG: hypothetical protein EOP85_00010 [Verrucomicrobiaceae bacterium]
MRSFLPFAAALLVPASAYAQGDLSPPAGVPAAGMKTLAQVEPRTAIPPSPAVPIAGPHFTIGARGSYYLTGNVTVSSGSPIVINSGGVTLDLNGYTISSNSGSPNGTAITINFSDVTVTNGHIVGGGFVNGIFSSSTAHNLIVSRVSVQGCDKRGIVLLSDSTLVEGCTVSNIPSLVVLEAAGIRAGVVRNSTARDCASYAINGITVSDCIGEVTAPGTLLGSGIFASVVINSSARNMGSGPAMNATESATNCTAYSTTGSALTGGVLQNCVAVSTNGGVGITCTTATNCKSTTSNNVSIVAKTASFCHVSRTAGGVALQATNAIGCSAEAGSTVTAANKSLGTP